MGKLRRIKPWEYGLGDKAYVGQRQIITEWKGRNLSLEKQRFNKSRCSTTVGVWSTSLAR